MGARISIQFENKGGVLGGDSKSVVLFSHWGGEEFLAQAKKYIRELKAETPKDAISRPLDRLEPETVMVDFIRYITKDLERVESDLYLGATENDGDNSDYGHHIIKLK